MNHTVIVGDIELYISTIAWFGDLQTMQFKDHTSVLTLFLHGFISKLEKTVKSGVLRLFKNSRFFCSKIQWKRVFDIKNGIFFVVLYPEHGFCGHEPITFYYSKFCLWWHDHFIMSS